MKGLILKDLINLKRYSRSIFVFIAIFGLFALMDQNWDFLEGMIILMFTMMTVTTFSYDDLAKWDPYALSLPVTRKQVVLGKYLVAALLAFSAVLLSLAVNGIFALVRDVDMVQKLITTYLILAAAIVFISILLPLIYKFGVEKSRIFLIVIFAAPTAAIIVMSNLGIPIPKTDTLMLLLNLSPAILVALVCGSYAISKALFTKKEL
jgi:ABC-2 type transport system permease protein